MAAVNSIIGARGVASEDAVDLWAVLAEAQHELGLTADDGATPRIRAEQLDELRSRYEALFDRAATAEQTIRDTHATLYRLAETSNISGLSNTITLLEAWIDG